MTVRFERASECAVATEIAARHLCSLGSADVAVEYEIDWAGPVDLPLVDEIEVQAACGIMHVHGRAGGRPNPLGVDYASAAAGVLGAQGVLAAQVARARGMRVDSVRTSVGQAALLAVSQYLAAATAIDDDCAQQHAAGSATFTSADGVRFEIEVLDADGWRWFWEALGADAGALRRGWRPFQQRFATATCALPVELHDALGRRTFTEIIESGRDSGVSVLRVRDQIRHRAAIRPWSITPVPGRAGDQLVRPRGMPLEGVVVVESTRRVQGPMIGNILRMLGADVVRIEPPGADPMRGIPPMAGDCSARFLALNAGKRVAEIDIRSDSGRREVHELVAGADVFVHNWAPGKAAQLDLDADALARTRPGLVYAWASGWGDAFGEDPPLGTDFLVQADSGVAAAIRPQGEPSAPSLMTLTDVLGGLVCAEGVLGALLDRLRTGRGQRVDSSLLSAAGILQQSTASPVWTQLDRPIRTEDGYLMLSRSSSRQPGRIADALGLGRSADPARITNRCLLDQADNLVQRLGRAGLSAKPVCTDLRELAADTRFADALDRNAYAAVRIPWEFS